LAVAAGRAEKQKTPAHRRRRFCFDDLRRWYRRVDFKHPPLVPQTSALTNRATPARPIGFFLLHPNRRDPGALFPFCQPPPQAPPAKRKTRPFAPRPPP